MERTGRDSWTYRVRRTETDCRSTWGWAYFRGGAASAAKNSDGDLQVGFERPPVICLCRRASAVAFSASVSLWRNSFSDHGGEQRVALYQHSASHAFSLSPSMRHRAHAAA